MVFKNATVYGKSFEPEVTDLVVEDGYIKSIGKTDLEGEDFTGKCILPGFIDIHVHGCCGYDCTDGRKESAGKMSSWLATNGVTSFCPTTMTISEKDLETSFRYISETKGNEPGAYIHGINMEGPFISAAKKGAQLESCIRKPDAELFRKLNGICNVCLVDIAPEEDDGYSFTKEISKVCRVSAAHTCATYAQIKEAEDCGLSHATHLFNAMSQLGSREPGAVGAVFDSEKIAAELICDGLHISPATLRIAFGILGEDRTCVISDATMGAGLPDGEYTLGGQTVYKKGAVRLADGTLAGSATNLFDEFKNIISYGIPVRQAIKSVTINPAREIGADKYTGYIEEGKFADLLVTTPDFARVNSVYIRGKKLF